MYAIRSYYEVSGSLQDGLSLDAALAQAREAASQVLPEGVSLGLSGTAEAFQESFAEFGLAISLAVLVIVITSYSIHYTKLYDSARLPRGGASRRALSWRRGS